MSRKPETMYTSKMMNKAAHEERKAARNARRLSDAFDRFYSRARADVAYVNVYGIAAPIAYR